MELGIGCRNKSAGLVETAKQFTTKKSRFNSKRLFSKNTNYFNSDEDEQYEHFHLDE